MYAIVLGIGGWAMNRAIDHGFIIGNSIIFSLLIVVLVLEIFNYFNLVLKTSSVLT